MDWNMLPQDVLGIILMKYVTKSEETLAGMDGAHGSVSLSTLQKRLWTASSVCSSWRHSLKDSSCMGDIHIKLNIYEVLMLCQPRDGESHQPAPPRSLFDFLHNTATGMVIIPCRNNQGAGEMLQYTNPSSFLQDVATLAPQLEFLQFLEVNLPDTWRNNSSFRAETIRSLKCLKELVLRKFTLYDFEHLPGSLRHLTIEYGEIWEKDILTSHSISIVNIPSGIFLETLSVKKIGVVGVITRQALHQVVHLNLDAMYVLMSVVVEDTELLDVFQRPYREGAYVPPHILGDWNAVETSHRATDAACTVLLESMGNSETLQSMTISGEGAHSLKIIPSLPGQEYRMLSWISSITEQASSLLYGMNGEEFQERLAALKMMRVIDSDRMQIDTTESSFRFQIKNN
eukprot:jgi/Picre1/31929/NNA_007277.t1